MKALISRLPGPPSSLTLEDIAERAPSATEVTLRVVACAANYPDVLLVQDRYQMRPARPFVPGAEISGVVTRVGSDVKGLALGDRVMAICDLGGMAEYVTVAARRCTVVPAFLPMDEAAALQLSYGTALYGLQNGVPLRAGERLLVLGAAGGVGLAAVEIGKALGAHVIGAVSSAQKAEVARAVGADETLLYPRGPFDAASGRALSEQFKDACGDGVDVIFDVVGGDYTEAALRAIARDGRLLVAGFAAGIARLPLNLVLLKEAVVRGVAWGAVVARGEPAYFDTIGELLRLREAKLIRPLITERLPLAQAAEGLTRLMERQVVGKLIIEPGRIS